MINVSTTKTVYQDREALRKKESTLFHVTNGWLPAQSETLDYIYGPLSGAESEKKSETLVSVLKQDLALFSKIVSKLKPSQDSENSTIDPLADLKLLSPEEIINLLPNNIYQVSKHRIEKGTAFQKAGLSSSLLSSTASETFAIHAKETGIEVSPDEVSSSSLMRQLGFNLIAWNYSRLFFKLVRTYGKNQTELDRAIYKTFGYTPLSLAEDYAKKWNLSLSLRSSLKETELYQSNGMLKEICELGEAFGKSSQPSLFPAAKREWEGKTDRLKELIGTDNPIEITEQIENSVEVRLKELLRNDPSKFNAAFSMLRPSASPVSVHFSSPILNRLPEEVREIYKPIYDHLIESETRLPVLNELTQSAIPASGFLTGAIYLQPHDSDELKVKIEIGQTSKNRVSAESLDQVATEALGSYIPLIKKEKLKLRISSSFTSQSHSGVLVLELDANLEDSADRNNLLLFKAARECLINCLG